MIGTKLAVGLLALSLGLGFVAVIVAFNFNFLISPFYKACTSLEVGLTKEEVMRRMERFTTLPYGTVEGLEATIGRFNDDQLTDAIVYYNNNVRRECAVLYKDSKVLEVSPLFE